METADRLGLLKESKEQEKLTKILDNRAFFQHKIQESRQNLQNPQPLTISVSSDASSDMVVCVRVRPRLAHEQELNYLESVLISNPTVTVFNPGFSVKGEPKLQTSCYAVDLAFGPEDSNEDIYGAVVVPLIDLALQGGICSMLAYGQTGSGKTFTISGLLGMLASDLFTRQALVTGEIKMHVCYVELLGNSLSDLLSPGGGKVEVMEDKFGKVNLVGAVEIPVSTADELTGLLRKAARHRLTAATYKNDTSSRSHAICKIRVENTTYKEAEDGCLIVVDLAGSENAADSQFHDKDRVKECQYINKSLMALKECIINRAKSSQDLSRHFHIPFRQSKLTLLLKDAFELESHKICRTVVFANLAPTMADTAMTLNTLRYVAPIKVGAENRAKVEPDPANPANWSNAELRSWVTSTGRGRIQPDTLCPWESGRQLLRIPEIEFLRRVMEGNKNVGAKEAKVFYDKLWKCLIDARTADRRKKMKSKIDHKKNIQEQDSALASGGAASPLENELDDWVARLALRGVLPTLIVGADGRLLAGSRTDQPMDAEQLGALLASIRTAAPGAILNFGGFQYATTSRSECCWEGMTDRGALARWDLVDGYQLLTQCRQAKDREELGRAVEPCISLLRQIANKENNPAKSWTLRAN